MARLEIRIEGFADLVAEIGEVEARRFLREQLLRAADWTDRHLESGGRVSFEYDRDTGREVTHVIPHEQDDDPPGGRP